MLRSYFFESWDEVLQPDSIDLILDNFEIFLYSRTDDQTRVELRLPVEAKSEDHRRLEFQNKLKPKIKERLENYKPLSLWQVYLNSFRQFECCFRVMYPLIYGVVAYADANPDLMFMAALAVVVEASIFGLSRYRRNKSRELLKDASNRIEAVYEERLNLF